MNSSVGERVVVEELGAISEVDAALKSGGKQPAGWPAEDPGTGFAARLKSLPAILRALGALALLVAAVIFMFQEWQSQTHLMRYFSFLGLTGALAAIGFFCAIRMQEDKSARTLLALAAGIIPVHFCQLGGLLYSCFSEGLQNSMPSYFVWVAPDVWSAGLSIAAAVLVLTPIAFISFSALCRPLARELAAAYIGANVLLLIPTRQPEFAGIVFTLLTLGLISFDLKRLRVDSAVRTREGLLCRVMLLTPAVLMLGRAVLYPSSSLALSVMCAGAAYVLFEVLPSYLQDEAARSQSEVLAMPAVGLSWGFFAAHLFNTFNVAGEYQVPIAALPVSLILAGMSFEAVRHQALYRKAAALLAVAALAVQLLSYAGWFSSFLMLSTSLLIFAYGHLSEAKFFTSAGLIGFLFGLLQYVDFAIEVCTISPWLTLAVGGIATVVGAAYVERHAPEIARRFGRKES